MSLVQIATTGGVKHAVTLLELSKRLDDPRTGPDVLSALVTEGWANVTLKGGVLAVATYGDPPPQPIESEQQVFPLVVKRPAPLRHYDVSADLYYVLPAQIRVRAGTLAEATFIINQVLLYNRTEKAPDGFEVELGEHALEELFDGLQNGLIYPHDLRIEHIEERKLLGAPS